MTSWKKRAEAMASKLDAALDTTDGEVDCIAPAGFIWEPDSVHVLTNSGTQTEMYRDAVKRMSANELQPCPSGCYCGEGKENK